MAKSTSRPPKTPTPIDASTPFDAPEADMSAAEAPLPEQTAEERPVPQERPSTSKNGPTTKSPTFIQTMNSVPKGDWGPRANIYLYRVEPVIDRTRSGDSKYINCYAEPIDEDRVMGDYGSGRYKLILNFRKPGAATGDIIDSTYWDIQNMKYPPKIPLGEWTDDPRNKKWAWAKEANGIPITPQQPAATGLETVVDVMRATGEMRREIREEMRESTPPAAPVAPVAADPFDTAAKIMGMRANDPMIAALMQRLDAADKAAEKARDREFELMKELRQQQAKPAEPQKPFMDQLLELAAMGEKLEPLKKLFGFGNGAEVAGRAARTTGLDVVRDLVTGPAGATLAQGIGVLISNLANAAASNPATPKAPPVFISAEQPNGTIPPVENAEQRIQRIGETVTRPMLGEYFMKNATGAEWAQAMFDLWPEDYVFMRTLGAENIVNRYRRYPEAWAVIGYREKDFIEFIAQFCAWDPNAEDGPVPPGNGDDGVVDLTEGEEAGS